MGVFSVITLAALVFVGTVVLRLNRMGTETEAPAALSTQVSAPMLTDSATGLSYALLGRPWLNGCPGSLTTSQFRWTGGEAAVAGRLKSGMTWYANACSGPLPRRFQGEGPAQAAWSMAGAIEGVYYNALHHWVTVSRSTSVRVGGRPGWLAEFVVHYDRGQHVAWSTELGAVVVTGHLAFYASVPDNLGTATVATLLSSLQ
jgi:hypothetical protein